MSNSRKSSPSSFSSWMRYNLLASWEGLITQDIDIVAFDNSFDSFILIEEKNSPRAVVTIPQAVCFKMLDEFLGMQNKCKYYGSYLIYYLNDNKIYINPKLKQMGMKWRYILDENNSTPIDKNALTNLICSNFMTLHNNHKNDWFSSIINKHIDGLWDCKGTPPNYGTREERSRWRGTKILNLCNHNRMKTVDWIFINYCTGYFILIEEKQNSNRTYKPDTNESLIIDKIHEIFTDADNKNRYIQKVKNPKSNVPYKYLGYFLLEFDEEGPEDSNNTYLNRQKITLDDLKAFLNLDSQKSEMIARKYMYKWW